MLISICDFKTNTRGAGRSEKYLFGNTEEAVFLLKLRYFKRILAILRSILSKKQQHLASKRSQMMADVSIRNATLLDDDGGAQHNFWSEVSLHVFLFVLF